MDIRLTQLEGRVDGLESSLATVAEAVMAGQQQQQPHHPPAPTPDGQRCRLHETEVYRDSSDAQCASVATAHSASGGSGLTHEAVQAVAEDCIQRHLRAFRESMVREVKALLLTIHAHTSTPPTAQSSPNTIPKEEAVLRQFVQKQLHKTEVLVAKELQHAVSAQAQMRSQWEAALQETLRADRERHTHELRAVRQEVRDALLHLQQQTQTKWELWERAQKQKDTHINGKGVLDGHENALLVSPQLVAMEEALASLRQRVSEVETAATVHSQRQQPPFTTSALSDNVNVSGMQSQLQTMAVTHEHRFTRLERDLQKTVALVTSLSSGPLHEREQFSPPAIDAASLDVQSQLLAQRVMVAVRSDTHRVVARQVSRSIGDLTQLLDANLRTQQQALDDIVQEQVNMKAALRSSMIPSSVLQGLDERVRVLRAELKDVYAWMEKHARRAQDREKASRDDHSLRVPAPGVAGEGRTHRLNEAYQRDAPRRHPAERPPSPVLPAARHHRTAVHSPPPRASADDVDASVSITEVSVHDMVPGPPLPVAAFSPLNPGPHPSSCRAVRAPPQRPAFSVADSNDARRTSPVEHGTGRILAAALAATTAQSDSGRQRHVIMGHSSRPSSPSEFDRCGNGSDRRPGSPCPLAAALSGCSAQSSTGRLPAAEAEDGGVWSARSSLQPSVNVSLEDVLRNAG